MKIVINLFLTLTFFAQTIDANESVLVHTQYGDVLGYQTDLARIFYGIPFAQPPIGNLRWEAPVPIDKWKPNVINATQPPPACAQPPSPMDYTFTPDSMSEDCLYLNIFTPLQNNSSSGSLLPVMLFIHGGDFQYGSASQPIYKSDYFVNTTNVVMALVQYRLGVLGFLATGNGPSDLKGNYGILDQRLAIAWIKANIDAFGGNPNEITLFGQSAGAQSTTLHYMNSEMQPFFERAIIQSAPMTIPFRTYLEYVTPTVLLAEQFHCSYGDIACFRNCSMNEIVTAQAAVNKMLTAINVLLYFEPWLPVIDNVTIHGNLLEIVRNSSIPLKPLIIGTVTEEAHDFVYRQWPRLLSSAEYVAAALAVFGEDGFKVLQEYPPDGSDDQRPVLVRVVTHWVFACSTRILARKGALYSYVFGYPFDTINSRNSIECSDHACHGDDLPFTFESRWINFTDAGRRVSRSMATYWTNFAKSVNPNEPSQVSLSWPRMNLTNESYVYIQDPLQIGENYLKDNCDFWDQIGYRTSFFQ